MELLTEVRGKLLPDPEFDKILAIFVALSCETDPIPSHRAVLAVCDENDKNNVSLDFTVTLATAVFENNVS